MNKLKGEQEIRKEKSEKHLKRLGAEYLSTLPYVEAEAEVTLRSPEEIGNRILCLMCASGAAEGINKKEILQLVENQKFFRYFTTNELKFLNKKGTTQAEKNKFMWQAECILILLWILKKYDIYDPVIEVNVVDMCKVLPKFNSKMDDFTCNLQARDKNEVIDLLDLIYRSHWVTRQNALDGITKIGKLNADVVLEWHYALNWVTSDDDWDDITTDT